MSKGSEVLVRLHVTSMWGSTRSAVLHVPVASSIAAIKQQIMTEMGINAQDIKLEREVSGASFGDDVLDGDLASNGLHQGGRLTVVSVDVCGPITADVALKYGARVTNASPDAPVVDKSAAQFAEEAPEYRTHEPGMNYEAICPTHADRSVIVPRGFGVFDCADDPVGRACPCCREVIPVENFTRIAVNNAAWGFDGVVADGSRVADKGAVGGSIAWVIADMHGWRRLLMRVADPNAAQEARKKLFHCNLCRTDLPEIALTLTLAKRNFCEKCAKIIRDRMEARQEMALEEEKKRRLTEYREMHGPYREAAEAAKKKDEWKKGAVALPGIGAPIALRDASEAQMERERRAALAALKEIEAEHK